MIKIKCGIHDCIMEWQGGSYGVNAIINDVIPESYDQYICRECAIINDVIAPESGKSVQAVILRREPKWKLAGVKLKYIDGVWWFHDDTCQLAKCYDVIFWEYIKNE